MFIIVDTGGGAASLSPTACPTPENGPRRKDHATRRRTRLAVPTWLLVGIHTVVQAIALGQRHGH